MNVVILTPDRVGSTLLQRVLTIYMQLYQFDQPVVNLHELTNGVMSYWSHTFNREMLCKPESWGYHQTLAQVVELLEQCNHYKTTRLAHYHIRRRQDSVADQLPFYQYINDNFFVISARRSNLLEHALSWVISLHSKKLNVYSAQEKFATFGELYQRQIRVDQESIVKYLDDYKLYLEWCDRHFQVQSYFNYERDIVNLEQYVLGLRIFPHQQITWQNSFGQSWHDYNRCHYLTSDLSGLGRRLEQPQLTYQPGTAVTVRDVYNNLSVQDQQFMQQQGMNYVQTQQRIDELVRNKVLVTGVPIKLQTMLEKRLLIENFDQVVVWYNQWVSDNQLGDPYDAAATSRRAQDEILYYHAADLPNVDQMVAGLLE